MYQALLTRKYLTSKVMPLLAAFAVILSVTTELTAWSVMGGFLRMLLESGRKFIGDVEIVWPNTGFAHYDDLVKRLEADPQVAAAAPSIETAGFLALPNGRVEGVLVKGVEPASFDKVTGYYNSVHWKPLDKPLPRDSKKQDPRLQEGVREAFTRFGQAGRDLAIESDGERRPGIVLGIEVTGYNDRMPGGWVDPFIPILGREVTLFVFPQDRRGRPFEAAPRVFPVVNEFRTGLYDYDANAVVLPLATLQRMLKLNEARSTTPPRVVVDPRTGETSVQQGQDIGVEPARITAVLVRGTDSDGARGLAALKRRCEEIYEQFAQAHQGQVPAPDDIVIRTWQDRNATLIGAVKKEIGLVVFLIGIVSVTIVFLILSIFWSMVSEKTKDIGILRALGASRGGIAWLWLRYGLAIGVVGSVLGLGLAYLLVTNINPIHEWIGSTTGKLFGEEFYIWDPRVYVFTEIPNRIDPMNAVIVAVAGAAAAVLGALIPAVRAASLRPVTALRFE